MSNWVDVQLDVLATTSDEIDKIEAALAQPCHELLVWVARKWQRDLEKIQADVKDLVLFKPTRNLGYLDQSLNKARRFENEFKDGSWGVVWSHVHFVSAEFPKAIFLAQYWDDMMSYGGKIVVHDGEEIRSSYDGEHRAQGREWALPNIFAPFENEHELGLQCGSLWGEWMEGMRRQLCLVDGQVQLHSSGRSEETCG